MKNDPLKHPNPALPMDELSQNMGWLRSLAAALVDDPNDADDLVQAALSVAISSKKEIHDLRGFLAGSLSKLVWNKRRAERHRADRLSHRAREMPREEPPAEHHLEAIDTMRVALDEVSKLPDAQARTISLRYVEELEISSIAERLGSAPSTVRSNLSPGLETLRRRLDDRFGDRSSWGVALVPFALSGGAPPMGAPVSSASDLPLAEAALNQAAAVTKPAAGPSFLSYFTSLATMKLALAAVAAPLLLILGYQQLVSGASLPAPSAGLDESESVESPVAQSVEPVGSLVETALVAVAAEPETAEALAITPDVTEPSAPSESDAVELTLVDLDRQLPIPLLDVIITPVTGGAPSQDGDLQQRVATDEAGRLQISDLPPGTTHLALASPLQNVTGMGPNFAPDVVAIDVEQPVFVMIGPTYPLAFSGLAVEEGTPMEVEIQGPGIYAFQPVIVDVTWGPSPFVRFPGEFPTLETDGVWTLYVRAKDGSAKGEATTEHSKGVLQEPLAVVLEGAGEIRFRASAGAVGPLRNAPLPFLTLEAGDGETLRILQLERAGGALVGQSGPLEPGSYAWSATGLVGESEEPLSGQVEVVAGEAMDIALPDLGGPHLERSVVVDASAVPDVDLSPWEATVVNIVHKDEMLSRLHPERATDLGPGMWRVPVGPVPQSGWAFALHPPYDLDGFQVTPFSFAIAESGPLGPMVVTRVEAVVPIRLTFVDSETGEPIPLSKGVEAAHEGGPTPRILRRGLRGEVEVPSDRASRFFCKADGYRKCEVTFDPGNSPSELVVRMQPGWSSLVRVVNLDTESVAGGVGVTVDGLDAGTTDSEGRLTIEGAGPPELIELRLDGAELVLALSPFLDGLLREADPAEGYGFAVKGR